MAEGMQVDIPKDEVHNVFGGPEDDNESVKAQKGRKRPVREVFKGVSRWKWMLIALCLIAGFVVWAMVTNRQAESGEAKISGDPGVVTAAAGNKAVMGQDRSKEVDDLAKLADEKDKTKPTYVQGLDGKLADAIRQGREEKDSGRPPANSSDQGLATVAKADASAISETKGSPDDSGARSANLDKTLENVKKKKETVSGFVRLDADKTEDDASGGGSASRNASAGNIARVSSEVAPTSGKVILPGTHLYAIQASDWNSWQPGQQMEALILNGELKGLKLIGKGVLSKDGVVTADYSQFTYMPTNGGPARTGAIKAVGQGLQADERGRRNLAQGSDQHYFQRYVAPAVIKFAGNLPAAQVAASTQNTQLQSIGGIGVATAPSLRDSRDAKVAYALANSGVSNVGDDLSARMAATPPESWVTKGVEIDVTILDTLRL